MRRVLLVTTVFVVLLALPAAAQVPPLPPLPPLPVGVGGAASTAGDLHHEVLTTETVDPTVIEAAPDGRLFIAERTGTVKILGPDGAVTTAGRIGVDARSNQCADCPGRTVDEGGLHGLLLAPDFDETGHLYAYYSVPNSQGVAPNPPKWPGAGGTQDIEGVFRLSRFTINGDTLDLESEIAVLENPAEWLECCHYGGDLEWLPDGSMLLAVGDDTNPHASSGYSPRDQREGREAWDADRTSQNPADRRGKVLRLNPDGTVPADNPHVDDPAYDPYVYAMGFRSNYRIAVDPASSTTFVGNVGPDASSANANRGPAGHDEFETIPAGGGTNHGWPHCIGDNTPYHDYDFDTQTAGAPLSCDGMTPADLYYAPTPSLQWPALAAGSRTAIAGVVYDGADGERRLPERLDGKLLLLEYSRNNLWSIDLDGSGHMDTATLTTEALGLRKPIDATVGADGALYIAEYGSGFYNNTTSRITRISGRSSVLPLSQGTDDGSTTSLSMAPGALLAAGLVAAGLVPLRRRRRTI
jgi:aldose sugar dehydrogenase